MEILSMLEDYHGSIMLSINNETSSVGASLTQLAEKLNK